MRLGHHSSPREQWVWESTLSLSCSCCGDRKRMLRARAVFIAAAASKTLNSTRQLAAMQKATDLCTLLNTRIPLHAWR